MNEEKGKTEEKKVETVTQKEQVPSDPLEYAKSELDRLYKYRDLAIAELNKTNGAIEQLQKLKELLERKK